MLKLNKILFPALVWCFCAFFMYMPSGFTAQESQAHNTLDAYAPLEEFISITPSNDTIYDPPLRACYISATTGGSALEMMPVKNDAPVAINVVGGLWIPVVATQIRTGTTATVVCGR